MKHFKSSSLKQVVASAFLALALIGVQQAAVLHWLGHSIRAAGGADKKAPAPALADHCDTCLAFSALGSGSAAPEFAFQLDATSGPVLIGADTDARPTACRLAFRSRAPPFA